MCHPVQWFFTITELELWQNFMDSDTNKIAILMTLNDPNQSLLSVCLVMKYEIRHWAKKFLNFYSSSECMRVLSKCMLSLFSWNHLFLCQWNSFIQHSYHQKWHVLIKVLHRFIFCTDCISYNLPPVYNSLNHNKL